MNPETKRCQNCHQEFRIEPEDFVFYEKIKAPPPTWCPECRNIRRMAWREEQSLYHDTCKLCRKPIISTFSPNGPFAVYCRNCWQSDTWDPKSYGMAYDFQKPFFIQLRTLMETVPRPALTGLNLVNSDYTHASLSCKNCYLVFWSFFTENSQYSYALLMSQDTYDSYITDNSDHAYQTLHSNRLYKVRFGYFADECFDSSFLFDCVGCSDCFGCVNVRKQKYHIFNEKLSKSEYADRMKYWDLGSYARLREAKEKFRSLYLSVPHRYAHVINSYNVTGDIIRDTKNCTVCFSALDGVQNCKYVYFAGLNLKDSYDVSYGGDTSELLYETFGTTQAQRVFFSSGGRNSREIIYCDRVQNSSNLFGCSLLRNGQYCILNKQYSREEYERLVPRIIEHMNQMPYVDAKGRIYRFGEFPPTELSAYAYNETIAFRWYPKTKEEVVAEGWRWHDADERSYQITLKPENLLDHIRDVTDSICEETVGCLHGGNCNEQCITAFRINRDELAFYREMNIALPRLCPNCRRSELLNWRNGFHVWRRKCMCEGLQSITSNANTSYANQTMHVHSSNSCHNEFETTFSPEKPEIVYCGECYRAEFL